MSTFADREWLYDFRELPTSFDSDLSKKAVDCLFEKYAKITKKWDKNLNSEWTCRLFLATRMLMSATLYINSEIYAAENNLRVVTTYLKYYATLSILRAICYSLPECQWDDGKLKTIGHKKAIETALQHISRFDSTVCHRIRKEIAELKAEREFISYRASSSGDDQIVEKNNFIRSCTLLAEIAQLNSEIIEESVTRNADKEHFVILKEYMLKVSEDTIDGIYFSNTEDAYRINWIARKHPYPGSIYGLLREGHVEDFFGSWCSKNENSECFDPDVATNIIFDF